MRVRWMAAAALVLWLLPGTAWGHAELVSAVPESGEKLESAPDHLALGFTETPVDNASMVEVIDGCGETLELAEVYRTEKTLHIDVSELGHPGKWKVDYDVLSAEDGHPSGGRYTFKVKGTKDCSVPAGTGAEAPEPPEEEPTDDPSEPAAAPTAEPASDEGSSFPVLPVAVAAIAILGVAFLARGASRT